MITKCLILKRSNKHRSIGAMNAIVIHSSVFLLLLSAQAIRIAYVSFDDVFGIFFVVSILLSNLLRHNDIHYARACQVILVNRIKIKLCFEVNRLFSNGF